MKSSCCSMPAFGAVSVLDFSHTNRYVVAAHCCFDLHFPGAICCGVSLHMLTCHLYISFGKVSIKLFAHYGCFLLLSFKGFEKYLLQIFFQSATYFLTLSCISQSSF